MICSEYAQFVQVTVGSRFMSFQGTVRIGRSRGWDLKILKRLLRITYKL